MNNRNMNGEDNTCLSLSLGGRPTRPRRRRDPPVEPSLTLSLSDDVNEQISSPVSSFSTIDLEIKREKDVMNMSEDLEMERVVSSRTSDEDEDGNVRKKLRLTKEQSALLEDKFKEHTTLNPKQKQALARQLNLRPRQVEVWFQNRRARTKLKQTEVEYEFLKRCCETLTNENRKLQREVTELKAVKLGPPVYMRLPAPTLSMCPSCERVVGEHDIDIDGISKGNNTAAGPFVSNPSHFLKPFTTHSATC